MKIHEYQAKEIFARYGVPIPRGYPAISVEEAEAAARTLAQETGSPVVVVKAQIHAGGRGKGGGVKVAKGGSPEVRDIAQKMLGMQLVTHQTGPQGQTVRRLYIEQGVDIARELYLGAVVDRDKRRVAFMASTEGGVEIEKVAAEAPGKIFTVHVDPAVGFAAYQARQLASTSMTTRSSAMPNGASWKTRTRLTPSSSRRRRQASITCRSTATSAVSSTGPALRWRRWTSSNTSVPATGSARPTF
jgi:succinyl-CoA synthetase beta subunit